MADQNVKAPDPLAVMAHHMAQLCVESPEDQQHLDAMAEARAKVAELVAADREYDGARRDWDYAIADPQAYSGEEMARVANRFETAIARRAAALAKFGPPA